MHAIAVTLPAGPGERPTLSIAETPTPEPGPGDVLLQVHAAGVNRADLLQARGGYPPPPGASPILGLEAAGTVVAVGEGADPNLIGTRASALLDGGGYAEYAVAPATQILPLPDDAAPTLAAALPEALATAWYNLVGLCHLHAGQTVLIQGGSGGVGHIAIIGLQQGRRAEIDLGQLMARRVSVHGSTLRARTRQEKAAIVAAATPYAPYIEPSVHAVVPLRRAGEAHALMEEPGTFGKVVLQVR